MAPRFYALTNTLAIGFDNSSVALAVEQVALQKNRIAIAGAVATTAFTGKNCTPNDEDAGGKVLGKPVDIVVADRRGDCASMVRRR